jgi:hypothetical protein
MNLSRYILPLVTTVGGEIEDSPRPVFPNSSIYILHSSNVTSYSVAIRGMQQAPTALNEI